MDPLFLLFHSLPQTDRLKVIGVYTSQRGAAAALERTRVLPGFRDEPEGFTIEQYEIDRDHWPRGFVRL
jgi:hypothetical protein